MTLSTGRNFLHTPGPTNIPDRVLRAMAQPAVDFSTPEFLEMLRSIYTDLKRVCRTEAGDVILYASNGHGAWEAALVNAFSPGDHVLVPGVGHFSTNWAEMAEAFGIVVETLPGDWRHGIDPAAVAAHLRADTDHRIKAVLTVHIDTATSLICDLPAIRKAIDDAGHPALFMVDTVAALGTVEFRMDDWGVDVAVGGSQKGLMQPPGLAFNAVSQKALDASDRATLPRLYWDWKRRQDEALREGLDMVFEEGMENAFPRHARLAEAVRRCVGVWARGNCISLNAADPREAANSVTTILVDGGHDIENFRLTCRDRFNVSIATGLGPSRGKAFRIGHMGFVNEPMIIGALAAVEASLGICGIPHEVGGVTAASEYLATA